MTDTAPSAQPEADAAPDIKIEELAELVSGMSRFLMILVRSKAFRNAAIGLTEWAALSALAKAGTLTEAKLGLTVGLPRPLAKALTETLVRAELASIDDKGAQTTVRLTDKGTAVLTETNTLLRDQFASPTMRKRRAIATANRLVNRRLLRGLRESRAIRRKSNVRRARIEAMRTAG